MGRGDRGECEHRDGAGKGWDRRAGESESESGRGSVNCTSAGEVLPDGTRPAGPAQEHGVELISGTRIFSALVDASQIASASEAAAMEVEGGRGWWQAPDPSTKTAKTEAASSCAGDMGKSALTAWAASTRRRERARRAGR